MVTRARTEAKTAIVTQISGLSPGGPVAETPRSQRSGPRFDPRSGNWIPRASTEFVCFN